MELVFSPVYFKTCLFQIHLVHDPFPRVRVRAIHTVTRCLELVKAVPCSDANIFPEYVLPGLAAVSGIQCSCFGR
jgi:hypothetical protein